MYQFLVSTYVNKRQWEIPQNFPRNSNRNRPTWGAWLIICRYHHCTILVHPLNFQAVPTEATKKLGVEMWNHSIMVAETPRSVPITKREGIVTVAENARRSVPTWKHCGGGGERKKKRTNLTALLRWRRTQAEAYQLESIVAVAENARRSVPTWKHCCGGGERKKKRTNVKPFLWWRRTFAKSLPECFAVSVSQGWFVLLSVSDFGRCFLQSKRCRKRRGTLNNKMNKGWKGSDRRSRRRSERWARIMRVSMRFSPICSRLVILNALLSGARIWWHTVAGPVRWTIPGEYIWMRFLVLSFSFLFLLVWMLGLLD